MAAIIAPGVTCVKRKNYMVDGMGWHGIAGIWGMADPKRKPRKTFIREWRKHHNLTLQKMVDRLEAMFGIQTTTATLSRTENGIQEYTQHLLEALAEALNCEPADLLMRPPGADDDIRLVWAQLTPEKRKQALEIIKVLKASA